MDETVASARVYRVTGQVQGVGFRPFVYRLAVGLGLAGTVRNDPAGVEIVVAGTAVALAEFRRRLASEAPALARIDSIREGDAGAPPPPGFRIVASEAAGAERGRVTVDTAACAECLAEMRDPADRHHRHALVNCVNCGPRYTIIRDLPYDRPNTTMAGFAMCPDCAREYEDPADRRFHAQPVCCPACGPRLELVGAGAGTGARGDPIGGGARLLVAGGILAVKGLGGYHLAADARSEEAVRRLRAAKGRDEKPFAVMVRDIAKARRLADLSPAGERLLASPAAPIVLAPARSGADLAAAVSGPSHRVGVMLPHTPLSHLLLAAGPAALVMTSGNRSEDPLIRDDAEAMARLGPFAGAVLRHDRPIERAVDDSVFVDAPTGPIPLRRARGLVPAPIRLPVAAPRPGIAAGGELKAALAVVRGGEAVLSQHLGDLSYAKAFRRFLDTLRDLTRLFDLAPEWIAFDAHPGYLSHREARRIAAAGGLVEIVVQHHHAHLAALLAEHGLSGPAVGVVCDGVGYGADGTAWGGEVLVGDLVTFRRAARLRPLELPGGDRAAVEIRRCALSWLFDAGLAVEPHLGRAMADGDERRGVLALLDADRHCPPSSGLGRLFDAAAALLGLAERNSFEAQSGVALEAAAVRAGAGPSGEGLMPLADGDPAEIDHRPLLRRLLDLLERGESAGRLAWLFHDAVADGLARAAAWAAAEAGLSTVGLTGGVFGNGLLTELTAARLSARGLTVLLHREVPLNDGGLALGQSAVAAARLTGSGARSPR
jgi:hydrogenase maturation protein HypF